MAHSKGLSVNDHLDVGRVSQGGVVRFPGLGWSSEKEEGAYQSPVRAGLWSYGELPISLMLPIRPQPLPELQQARKEDEE